MEEQWLDEKAQRPDTPTSASSVRPMPSPYGFPETTPDPHIDAAPGELPCGCHCDDCCECFDAAPAARADRTEETTP